MRVTTDALVLSTIKYAESSLIVKAFTASDGLKSYLLRGILASKKGKLKAAYFQPLTQLNIVAIHKNKQSLEHISEAKIAYPYRSAHTHIVKNSLVLFLSELLTSCIVEEEENKLLFEFLTQSLIWLDNNDSIANFHLQFLVELSMHLGIYPDLGDEKGSFFNLSESAFTDRYDAFNCMGSSESDVLKKLLLSDLDSASKIKIDKATRSQLLKELLKYYQMHLSGFRIPKSLEVLNSVFSVN